MRHDAQARIVFDPHARIVFDDGSTAYDMACSGYGIVWAPEWLALDDVRRGRVVEVLGKWRSGEMLMSVVRRERRLTPHRVRVVIDFLGEAAKFWQAGTAPPRKP